MSLTPDVCSLSNFNFVVHFSAYPECPYVDKYSQLAQYRNVKEINEEHGIVTPLEILTDRPTNQPANRKINRPTDRPTNLQTNMRAHGRGYTCNYDYKSK